VSPAELGHLIKPFVFVDHVVADPSMPQTFGLHPHSGIATFSVLLEGSVGLDSIHGGRATIDAGGAEWMSAGSGVWHAGATTRVGTINGYQIWVGLPSDTELADAHERFVAPDEIPVHGPARVLLGELGDRRSPVDCPLKLNCLDVDLESNEHWNYTPPAGHDVLWVCVHDGSLTAGDCVSAGELAIFEHSERSVEFVAQQRCRFLLGSATLSPHDLCIGEYSVHTSVEALRQGEQNIEKQRETLRQQGLLK
jgi:redox-sensitive bicupin YhaK (pirin superfamily)